MRQEKKIYFSCSTKSESPKSCNNEPSFIRMNNKAPHETERENARKTRHWGLQGICRPRNPIFASCYRNNPRPRSCRRRGPIIERRDGAHSCWSNGDERRAAGTMGPMGWSMLGPHEGTWFDRPKSRRVELTDCSKQR